ncbi:MAG TPA: response regulator [Thermoanaerobaculia bacterium]|nr:response regulator [Thermoanaerobaculia bacterium]
MSENERITATILNVDDNEATLYMRTHALQHAGFQVIEADRGAKVMPLIATFQPDLILLDVHLPDANGYEITRMIKAHPVHQSTIVVQTSASSVDRRDRLHGFAAGADSYFLEPMEPEELVANVTALLRMRKMERELRRSAIEWQKTFEAVHDGVAIVLESGTITRCNPAFENLCGTNAVGKTLQEIFDVNLREIGEAKQIEDERNGRYLRLSIEPVLDHLGQMTHFACTLTDVTSERAIAALNVQLKDTIANLKRANEVADAASRAKDEFLATLSHELRTPMTAIIGWAQMLRMFGKGQDNTHEVADAILVSARAQAQLVEDLLDLSRITTGKLQLRTAAIELAEVVEGAVQTVVPAVAAKQITLDKHIANATVTGDRNRLQQVVWNLLSNAVKFTPDGGRIAIRLERVGTRAVVSVADSGRGIEPGFLPAVFDRFSQAENVSSRSTGGLGLGLAIVRSIVELHGGTVTAESPGAGQGATFRVSLPLSDEIASHQSAVPQLPTLDEKRILIVDDSIDALNMLTSFLRAAGAIVFAATSAKQARAIDGAEDIEAVVADLSMPEENGLSLIRSMRAARPERMIVAISALGGTARDEAMRNGATAFIAKPFDPGELVRLLAR